MILPREEITSRGIVTHYIDTSQFQPAGVDLTVREIYSFKNAGAIDFDNKERKLSDCKLLKFDKKGWLKLKKGAYKVIYNEVVEIPKDCAALAYPRSSLLRCGAFMHCAVWDPGYKGRSESLMIVSNEKGLKLKKNAKVVQLVLFKLTEHAKQGYSGRFRGENI